MTVAEFTDSVGQVLCWADMPICPYCGERGGEPVYLEGRSPSRWYNGETGDPGVADWEGCSLCYHRLPTLDL